MHISDGDTECIQVNKVIIFVGGRAVNMVDIAVKRLTSIARGNSPNIQGVTISTSNRFSMSIGDSFFTSSKDFNGFNRTVNTDVGIRHRVDGAISDSFRKKRK